MDISHNVDAVIKARGEANQPVWNLIRKIKNDKSLSRGERHSYLSRLYNSLSDRDLQERNAGDSLLYDVGTSFRSGINDLRRTKQRMRLLDVELFPGGNPKLRDRAFAESLGVPVPKTFAAGVPLDEIELMPESILKPEKGSASKGVFFVDGSLKLHSMVTSQVYETLETARSEIERFSQSISTARWILEEAILTDQGEPAVDFKAYSFYGVVGLVLEIDRFTSSGRNLAAYSETGRQIKIGPKYGTIEGSGLPDGIREISRRVSLAAPVPFVRIDFHYGRNGLYLGEITPHPGGTYAGDLFEEIDIMLGQHFADAKARLYIDFLNGKKFPEFHSAYGDYRVHRNV